MIPWSLIATTPIPGGDRQLRLMRRGAEFSIMLGDNELMNSRLSGSEEALARLACEKFQGRKQPRILIGGLGMGFTLRTALAMLAPDAGIIVCELVPAVVTWAREPLAAIFGDSLKDARLDLRESDVGEAIHSGRAMFDAILLDVDNGPGGLMRDANTALYGRKGLTAAYAALRPGGVLAVWSSGPDAGFTERLKKTGFAVDEVPVRANGRGGGARHIIWVATRVDPAVSGIKA